MALVAAATAMMFVLVDAGAFASIARLN